MTNNIQTFLTRLLALLFALFLALQFMGIAQASTLPPGYLAALEQAAKTIEQDQVNRALKASLNMPVMQDQRWENATVASVVAQYWSAYPGSRGQLVEAAKQRFPWYVQQEASALNAVTQASTGSFNQALHPSSQYYQPSLQKYGGTATLASLNTNKEPAEYPVLISDPFEGMNRGIFYFNAKFDQYLFVPVTDAYKFITPDIVEMGVHNFFENITEITSFGNEILQLHFIDAGKTALRFGINTTVGIAGLLDVAKLMGLPQDKEDFGQTLGRWGVGDGPYIVIPILGPSNLRDATGEIVDSVAFTLIDPFTIASFRNDYPAIYAAQAIDTRAAIDYRYHESGSPFEYDLIRYLISKKRQLDILK